MKDKLEKSLKRWLKGRVKLSLGTMIAFLLTGIASYTAEEDTFLIIGKDFVFNKIFEDSTFDLDTRTYTNNSELNCAFDKFDNFVSALRLEEENLNFINNSIIEYNNLTGSYSYQNDGLRYIAKGTLKEFVNNGTIISYNDKSNVTGSTYYKRSDGRLGGISVYSNSFTNNGLIKGTEILKNKRSEYGTYGTPNQYSSGNNGITWEQQEKIEEIKNGTIINNGNIFSFTSANMDKQYADGITSFYESTNGILIRNSTEEVSINNKGRITTFALANGGLDEEAKFSSSGNGILGYNNLKIDNIGMITGYINSLYTYERDTNNSGNGIVISEEEEGLSDINNKGLISGSQSSIALNENNTGIDINNYGLLVGQKIIGNGKFGDYFEEVELSGYKNYGIEIITEQKKNGDITTTEIKEVIVSNEKSDLEDYTVLNAQLIPSFNDLTYSLTFDNDSVIEKHILNGVENTLLIVTGATNTLKDSIINGFKSAVDMHNNSTLVLENSVVNGGADISSTYDEETREFTVSSTPVINITGDNTNLVLKETLVNGDMKADGKDNFLTLENMYVYHNIDGFENMIINGNTTLNEEAEITGTDTITISKDGTLTLSLKSTDEEVEGVKKATHSLNNGEAITIQGEGNGTDTAGTLKFITNGIGKEIYVDMENVELKNLYIGTSSAIDKAELGEGYVKLGAGSSLDEIFNKEEVTTPEIPSGEGGETEKPIKTQNYEKLDSIYKGIYSSSDENLDMLRNIIGNTNLGGSYDENNNEEQLKVLMTYLNNIYSTTPYSYTSEASRNSMKLFSDVVEESNYKSKEKEVLVYGGLTHSQLDRGTELLGRNYHNFDTNSIGINGEIKTTGAYGLVEYGLNDTLSIGTILGGNKHNIDIEKSSSEGTSAYLGAYLKHTQGKAKNTLGIGVQYTEYDTTRDNLGYKYSGEYSDVSFNIYGQTKYSHRVSNSLYIEPSLSLNYSYVMQEDIKEEKQPLSLNVKSKDFSVLEGTVGLDIRKEIVTEKARHNLVAGVGYTRILSGAEENSLTGDFGGSSFDLLIPSKNEDSLSIGVKYQVERKNGFIYDLKGSYNLTKDTENKEMRIGAGLGYKF